MQFFNFIFLARSWASDRHYLVKELATIGRRAEQTDIPLTFILYPEGTLVSKDTRPISKKYADKMGIVSGATLYSLVLANGRCTAGHGTHTPSEIDWPALQPQGTVTADTEFAAHRHHCRIPRSVLFYLELSAMWRMLMLMIQASRLWVMAKHTTPSVPSSGIASPLLPSICTSAASMSQGTSPLAMCRRQTLLSFPLLPATAQPNPRHLRPTSRRLRRTGSMYG